MTGSAHTNDQFNNRDPLTGRVIELAIEVHKALGPGLLESAYAECLAHELELAGIRKLLLAKSSAPSVHLFSNCV